MTDQKETAVGASELSDQLGAWSSTAPAAPGHYWVWQPEDTWPCKGSVHCVVVEAERNGLAAWVPFMDFSAPVTCSDERDIWAGALWLGPIRPPQAPNAN